MDRRQFLAGTAALATGAVAKPAIAQGATEVSFFYPIAVGGPITKLIDAYAADFEKETPAIKVKPIYAGTYQETIVKALTAHKSGTPPVTSVLLSTDMFTLIDEEAIVPIDPFVKTDDDKKWIQDQLERVETNLLTAFHQWASPREARLRMHSAALRAVDLEIEELYERVKKMEGRTPPAS